MSSEGEQIFGALAASAFARRAAWSRPVRRRPGKQGGRPGGRCCFARRKQESAARPDRLLVVAPSGRERDVLCDCCNDTGAVASRSSGRLDTPALGLEAEARSCGNRAEDAGAALLRAFQISALASRGPTARHCRNRRKDGMGTTALPSRCGQMGLIGSSDDDRGDRSSACAPRRCGCALRVGAVVQVRRSGARRARPTIALPRTCERQTHCVAPPRPSVAAATRAVGPSACG
jgi:hypothetical protein